MERLYKKTKWSGKNLWGTDCKSAPAGVHLPISKEIYEPILAELAEHDIVFTEKEVPYLGY